jgi:DNA polymerase-1
MPRLFLLDGTALAYRSHFALARSGLATVEGKSTGATYGFTMTLRRLIETEAPEALAVAFDPPGNTFRHARFPHYKATRQKMPDDLLVQMDWMREVVLAHGVPVIEVAGYEADDVIGTLTRRATERGWQVLIVTADKDMMQLVGERVQLYNVFKAEADVVLQGPEAVREKFGTTPEHVVDVLAIMGDSSDNVPGVSGIGEKGAVKLISEYGSLENLLAHLADLPPKTREKIEASRSMLALSRELVTIDRDVPLTVDLDSLGPARPDAERCLALFRRLEFKTLVEKVAGATERTVRAGARDWRTVKDAAELDAMIATLAEAGAYALDTETTSLHPMRASLVGLSFALPGRAWYVPCNAEPPVLPGGRSAILERLRPLLSDEKHARTGQNTKYDWLVLERHGVRVPPPEFDTMIASFCVSGSDRGHGIDELALRYLGLKKIATKELLGRGKAEISMDLVPIERVAEYACEDADVTLRVRAALETELDATESRRLFETLEMPLVPVLAAMEERGIRVDLGLLERLRKDLHQELQALVFKIQELAGENVNVNSPKALGQVLFEKLRIHEQAGGAQRVRRTSLGYATDAETLEERYGEVEIVKLVLEYRELAKLQGTYVEALPRYVHPETGRIHCCFSQVSAVTGRLASSEPNLQNIPVRTPRGRQLREAFVPPLPDERGRWLLLAADYNQIELRIMAHLSGDPHMQRAFREGHDVHAATATRLFGVLPGMITREQRSQAKVINFGLLYGMGPQRVARETGLSLAEARAFIERYFATFPAVREWREKLLAHARRTGYVETLLGRRRRMVDLNSGDARVRAFAENAAVNTPVQGSAADVIKRAMIELEPRLAASGLHARLLLQVHDELVLEVPEQELQETIALVRAAMEGAVELSVPLHVDFGHGQNWLEAH